MNYKKFKILAKNFTKEHNPVIPNKIEDAFINSIDDDVNNYKLIDLDYYGIDLKEIPSLNQFLKKKFPNISYAEFKTHFQYINQKEYDMDDESVYNIVYITFSDVYNILIKLQGEKQ
jgi:hypothetical protein